MDLDSEGRGVPAGGLDWERVPPVLLRAQDLGFTRAAAAVFPIACGIRPGYRFGRRAGDGGPRVETPDRGRHHSMGEDWGPRHLEGMA